MAVNTWMPQKERHSHLIRGFELKYWDLGTSGTDEITDSNFKCILTKLDNVWDGTASLTEDCAHVSWLTLAVKAIQKMDTNNF